MNFFERREKCTIASCKVTVHMSSLYVKSSLVDPNEHGLLHTYTQRRERLHLAEDTGNDSNVSARHAKMLSLPTNGGGYELSNERHMRLGIFIRAAKSSRIPTTRTQSSYTAQGGGGDCMLGRAPKLSNLSLLLSAYKDH